MTDIEENQEKKKKPIGLTKKSFINITVALAVIFFMIFLAYKFLDFSASRNLKKGKYEKAATYYSLLMSINPDIVRYKMGYADSLMKMPFNYKTQTLICNFLEKYEDEDYAVPLKERLKKFKSKLDLQIGENYIDKAPLSNQILRWEDDAFPLKVNINGGEPEYRNSVKQAFDYWTYTTGNFVSFVFIDDASKADVKVNISGAASTNCPNGGCYFIAAITSPEIKGGILQYMEMNIHTKDPYGKVSTPHEIYKVTLHEIGHVLGIMGHSDNPENIMYASGQHHEDSNFAQYRSALSRQDLNTLNYLYMIVPNISNIPENKHDTTNKVNPNVILGTTKEIQKRDIDNALKYIQSAPNLAIGYIDLANAYVQAEMYDDAMKTYQKAYNLSVDTQEKYDIAYNMSTTCIRMGDRDKALEYAEFAQKIMPTDEIAKLIHDIKYPFSVGNSRI